jgi:DNA-3-methyladenine glycosylase
MMGPVLGRDFYARDAVEAAPLLLGKLLCRRTEEGLAAGMIVETEAYRGPLDDAAHSFGGRPTERTRVMFGPPGHAYVFSIYGMHSCLNAVTGGEGQPQAVLIRALEPVEGLSLMAARRGVQDPRQLCSGPGKLCQALGVTRAQNGLDLTGEELFLTEYRLFSPDAVCVSPRVNVDYAVEYRYRLWRFFLKDHPCVSRVPRRYAARGTLE